jgi:radical SAM protein with 4Fe4S-binding SPASM domain
VELSTTEIGDILDQLAASGALVLTLTGGDILARPDFMEIARYARRLRFALRLFTNGSGWDAKMAEKARDLHPLSVDVSLYGSRPEVYEAVTGDGRNFSLAFSGIHNLKRQGIFLTAKIPVLEENYEDLPGIIGLCRELEIPYTMSANITPRDDGSPLPLKHTLPLSRCGDFLCRYEKASSGGRRRPDDHLCNTARNSAVISPYGDVYPCVQIKKPAGNLRENDFQSIWGRSPILTGLRQLRVKDLEKCTGCAHLDKCAYCPGISYWESGSFLARDHSACRWTHLRADLGLV